MKAPSYITADSQTSKVHTHSLQCQVLMPYRIDRSQWTPREGEHNNRLEWEYCPIQWLKFPVPSVVVDGWAMNWVTLNPSFVGP